MAEIDQVWHWLVERLWIGLPVAVVLLLALATLVAGVLTTQRCRALLAAFGESTGSRLVIETGPGRAGFKVHFQPPPEPFDHLTIRYEAAARFDPVRWFTRTLPRDRLWIQAALDTRPGQELQWRRGAIPGRAAGHTPSTNLWTIHRLDFIESEFATRGANPAALIHVFTELQTRFEPLLYEFSLLREAQPTLTITLRGRGLEPLDVFPLVALVRAAGRAARLD
jgi:hypothetical protein